MVVERMAVALQASQLLRHAPSVIADAFVATRLAGDGGMHYGTLPAGTDVSAIVDRHVPVAA
jgi:putative acyl-CoA dehydrogenase